MYVSFILRILNSHSEARTGRADRALSFLARLSLSCSVNTSLHKRSLLYVASFGVTVTVPGLAWPGRVQTDDFIKADILDAASLFNTARPTWS
jgi:hypothetical protein